MLYKTVKISHHCQYNMIVAMITYNNKSWQFTEFSLKAMSIIWKVMRFQSESYKVFAKDLQDVTVNKHLSTHVTW